ncbi:btaf1 RNA polymerase II, B-TFIID transcription factor-associated, 170kDa [Entophlyctis sp. JEL0112]|nr:btaf1 RNA polymerase II, B-TFIID transcription factor-associated, 170kDa [Entophlyctis sp. JEL0112]
MTTRLDRLVLLLDTGSTSVVRSTAAQQIGDVQRQHPDELYSLLARVLVHLRSKSWETRTAASAALSAIAKNVPQWNPSPGSNNPGQQSAEDQYRLSFESFEITNVIRSGAPLLSSAGGEFDVDFSGMNGRERIAFQKQLVKKRLGLESEMMDLDLVNEADFKIETARSSSPPVKVEAVPKQLLDIGKSPDDDPSLAGLSARERIARKRKMKLEAKKNSGKDKVWAGDLSSSSSKKQKLDSTVSGPAEQKQSAADEKVVVKHKGKDEEALSLGVLGSSDEWPFEGLCEQLCIDLFNLRWEIRHGAALGLMEVIKAHGDGAGKVTGVDATTNRVRHAQWLEDVAIRILCVLALDRFADFVGDHVVVPVRETCARLLGVLVQRCDSGVSFKVLDGLLTLVHTPTQSETSKKNLNAAVSYSSSGNSGWEMRHAALIGLKYWMASKKSLVKEALVPVEIHKSTETGAFSAILNGLKDHDDDVRAVSSSTLLPICDLLVTVFEPQKIHKLIVLSLWDTLEELDDLTAATASIMDLLSQLLQKTQISDYMRLERSSSFANFVPRLYPFFRHAIPSVRTAVLKTVSSLLDVASCDNSPSSGSWISPDLLRLIFQNFLLEERKELLSLSLTLWTRLVEFCGLKKQSLTLLPFMESWFALLMMPIGTPLDLELFFHFSTKKTQTSGLNVPIQDRAMVQQDLHVVSEDDVLGGRLAAATALGRLLVQLSSAKDDQSVGELSHLQELFVAYMCGGCGSQRFFMHVVVQEWVDAAFLQPALYELVRADPFLERARTVMNATLEPSAQVFYTELFGPLARLRVECQSLINAFAECQATGCPPLPPMPSAEPITSDSEQPNPFGPVFTYNVAERFLNEVVPQLFDVVNASGKFQAQQPLLRDRKNRVVIAMEKFATDCARVETQVLASAASAIVQMGKLPSKLNPIIRSLMASIKSESSDMIQNRSAASVAKLLQLNCKLGKSGGVVDKVVKNLGVHLCNECEWGNICRNTDENGILSLASTVDNAETMENSSQKKKKESSLRGDALTAVEALPTGVGDFAVSKNEKSEIAHRGARVAFGHICETFEASLFTSLPKLWELVSSVLEFAVESPAGSNQLDPAAEKCRVDKEFAQIVADSLLILAVVVQEVHPGLHGKLCSLLRPICRILRAPLSVLRNIAGRCISSFVKVCTSQTMSAVVENVLPLLGDSTSVIHRQGAAECISLIVQSLDESQLLPYIVFLIVPVLGRMSDPDESVRFVSTSVFAQLVKLVPLESGVPNPEGMDAELIKMKQEERKFMSQLVGSEKVEDFQVPEGIDAELRPYQKEGVSWLAFLNRYGLHGILCDDMGLGKTLQSICMLASDHHIRATKFLSTGSPEFAHTPSIVVCPPTLTGHWRQEILQFASKVLKPMIYVGGPSERSRLRALIPSHDVVITSYEILRNDIDNLTSINYNYCILDEGHVIKNAKTKLTKAVKSLRCMNRLILSGTPVQNNVLELWSLFDFLMPGFLGTESQFQAKFGKPILASRDAKSSSKEQEKGALALEALHKQVLPFLMRRMKEDVLNDLPPKIIQDFYVDLGDIQKQLYEDFGKTQNVNTVMESDAKGSSKNSGETHVFQALQYLRKLCNHPSLVLKPEHPQYNKIMGILKEEGKSINDITLSPKIMGLKQILIDCGIGGVENDDPSSAIGPITAPHRVLVFAQLREMLDHIENGLFKEQMKSVTYLRMDGTTDTSLRHEMVQKFNADPSIDVFLLTTNVGGLGLNLTGADTVIFIEHDWNPMKDLQAMDRAHRIGQKRVVNVYRLITRGTLEEKIMGLQKFKLNIASSIINADNTGIESMDTKEILDLFSLGDQAKGGKSGDDGAGDSNKKATTKEILEGLGALWDEKQYEDMTSMEEFK